MGGMCDEPLSANTYEEIIAKGMEHLKALHQEMAATIEAMPKDHSIMVEWGKTFQKTWADTKES